MTRPSSSATEERHHIWCNFYGVGLSSECRQCKSLKALYHEKESTPDELQKKYFPNAIKREGT